MGNICRSPMGEAVFQHLIAGIPQPVHVEIDSAGTDAYHEMEPPDSRTMATLKAHGVGRDYDHAARRVASSDFQDFDYLFAMDRYNLQTLKRKQRALKSKGAKGDGEVRLFGEVKGDGDEEGAGEEIGDPYYGGTEGFEVAFEQCVRFSQAWIRELFQWDVAIDAQGTVTVTKTQQS